MQLGQNDLRRSLDFLREHCAPATLETFIPNAVEGLFRLSSCESVSCGIVNLSSGEGSATGYPTDLHPAERSSRAISIGMRDLAPKLGPLFGTGTFTTVSRLMGRAEFRRSALYNEYFRNRGVEDVAALPSPLAGGLAGFFSVERRRDFSRHNHDLLNAVAGPLQAALSNAATLTELKREKGLLKSTLESTGWTGLVVNHQERICLESPRARELLLFYFGREVFGDRLPDSLLRWMRARADRLRQPATAPPPSTPFSVARDGRRLMIRMVLHPSGYMLLLEEDDDSPPGVRLQTLGISAREAEVLSWIAAGKTGPEISILLRISHDTVRRHTSRIFEKLGVETRTAAAAIALDELHKK